jgi:DNA-directed RNA polymerase specialized sigma24 family protein
MVFSMEMETPTPVPHVEAGDTAAAWVLVEAHDRLIKRIVRAAVRRGRVHYDAAEDALEDARLIAYNLAVKHVGTKEQYRNYLAATLSREFRFDIAHLHDALDRPRAVDREGSIDQEEDVNDPEDWLDNVLEDVAKDVGLSYNESSLIDVLEPPPPAPTLKELIARIPGPRAAIARMAFLENVSSEEIAQRTGRSPAYLHRTLKFLRRVLGIPEQ